LVNSGTTFDLYNSFKRAIGHLLLFNQSIHLTINHLIFSILPF